MRDARLVSVLLLVVFRFVSTGSPAHAEPPGPAGHWEGAIELPGQKLAVDVDLALGDGGVLTGDISIPAQMARDLPLEHLSWSGAEVSFEIAAVPGTPTFKGTLSGDGARIAGTFTQGGAAFPFTLERRAGAAAASRDALAEYGAFFEAALEDWEVPGGAIAVVRDGTTVYSRGFGFRDVGKKLPVTPRTLFAIGSSTKAFTTFVMGTLVDEGRLAWDKPVRTYLPEFRLHDPSASERITPRDLVTHRSGLPRHDALWYNRAASRADMISRLPYLENNEDLRGRFQYNNMMFLAAGYLVERITGSTWEEAVRNRILRPLGMDRTNFSVLDSQKSDDFAKPYDKRDDVMQEIPFRDITNVGPAGSINSSVEEMARWVAVHLSHGIRDGKPLVRKETLTELHTPQMVTGTSGERPDIIPIGYAMGWFVDSYRGHLRVQHGGAIDGFGSLVTLFPNDGLGLVVLQNFGNNGFAEIMVRHAADRLLGLDAVDWNADALAKRKMGQEVGKEAAKKKTSVRKSGTKPSHPIADYAGTYEHPGYGIAAVVLKDGRLELTYNDITTPLEHWHYDVFNGAKGAKDPALEDQKFLFRTNVKGNVDAVAASLEPFVADIVFVKKPDARMSAPAFLARFLGAYELAGQTLTVGLQGSTLTLSVPGQPLYELAPDLGDEFRLERISGYSLRFETDKDGKPTAMVLLQPDGVFTAKRM